MEEIFIKILSESEYLKVTDYLSFKEDNEVWINSNRYLVEFGEDYIKIRILHNDTFMQKTIENCKEFKCNKIIAVEPFTYTTYYLLTNTENLKLDNYYIESTEKYYNASKKFSKIKDDLIDISFRAANVKIINKDQRTLSSALILMYIGVYTKVLRDHKGYYLKINIYTVNGKQYLDESILKEINSLYNDSELLYNDNRLTLIMR